MLTCREGRQPSLWEETLALLPLHRSNHLRVWKGQDGAEGLRDLRWVENLSLGSEKTTVVLCGEMPAGEDPVLYVHATKRLPQACLPMGRTGHRHGVGPRPR